MCLFHSSSGIWSCFFFFEFSTSRWSGLQPTESPGNRQNIHIKHWNPDEKGKVVWFPTVSTLTFSALLTNGPSVYRAFRRCIRPLGPNFGERMSEPNSAAPTAPLDCFWTTENCTPFITASAGIGRIGMKTSIPRCVAIFLYAFCTYLAWANSPTTTNDNFLNFCKCPNQKHRPF